MEQRRRIVGVQPRWEDGKLRWEWMRGPGVVIVPNADADPNVLPPSAALISPTPILVRPVPQVSITRGVVKTRRDTSHLFHLVMTLLTGGLWAVVWFLVTIWHAVGPRRKSRIREETRTS